MRCKAPQCAPRGAKCACPNPWIEFVSRRARRRRHTRAEHAAAYHQAKAAGQFAIPPGALGERCRPCKSDAVKLCTWHASRKLKLKDPHAAFIMAHRARGQAAVRAVVRSHSRRAGRAIRVNDIGLHRLSPPIVVEKKLGEGGNGVVYLVHEDVVGGKRMAMKVVRPHAMKRFSHEVAMQKLFSKWLLAPKVHHQYVYKGIGVILMDPVHSVLTSVVKDLRSHPRRRGVMRHLAQELKRVTQLLNDHRLSHGDLHTDNVAYQLRRGVPRLMFIDFGRSFKYPRGDFLGQHPREVDIFYVWRSLRYTKELYPALLSVGFPKSHFMEEAGATAKPDPNKLSRPVKDNISKMCDSLLRKQYSVIGDMTKSLTQRPL